MEGEAIDGKEDDMNEELKRHAEALREMGEEMKTMNSKFDDAVAGSKIDAIIEALKELERRIAEVEESTTTRSQKLLEFEETIKAMNERMKQLEENVRKIQSKAPAEDVMESDDRGGSQSRSRCDLETSDFGKEIGDSPQPAANVVKVNNGPYLDRLICLANYVTKYC